MIGSATTLLRTHITTLLAAMAATWPVMALAETPDSPMISESWTVPEILVPGTTTTIFYENSSWSRDSVFLHAGFDGWNLATGEPDSDTEVINGNTNHFVRRAMRYDPETKRFLVEIAIPKTARALHFVFCRNRCESGEWDHNNRRDFNRPLVFPYIGPILTWNQKDSGDNSIVVSFEHPQPGQGWIEYSAPGKPPVRKYSSRTADMHRIILDGLKPDTRYEYRVGIDDSYKSPAYKFKTLKMHQGSTDLKFLVFGDAQDNGETGRFRSVVQAMESAHADVDFVISTGDLPWNDHPGDWWSFFDRARTLFASKVVMPALGNHDTPGTSSSSNHESFNYYFSHPGTAEGKSYYRFDIGSAAFFAMNSERPYELKTDGDQYRWLRQHLNMRQQNFSSEATWSFAYWHIPPFNAGARHWQQQFQMRESALLFDGRLDWHFGGHEHLYQRMKPLGSDDDSFYLRAEYGTSDGRGVGYLIVPSGGTMPESKLVSSQGNQDLRRALAWPQVDPSQNVAASSIGFTRVEINGANIILKTFGISRQGKAAEIDRVSYSK